MHYVAYVSVAYVFVSRFPTFVSSPIRCCSYNKERRGRGGAGCTRAHGAPKRKAHSPEEEETATTQPSRRRRCVESQSARELYSYFLEQEERLPRTPSISGVHTRRRQPPTINPMHLLASNTLFCLSLDRLPPICPRIRTFGAQTYFYDETTVCNHQTYLRCRPISCPTSSLSLLSLVFMRKEDPLFLAAASFGHTLPPLCLSISACCLFNLQSLAPSSAQHERQPTAKGDPFFCRTYLYLQTKLQGVLTHYVSKVSTPTRPNPTQP